MSYMQREVSPLVHQCCLIYCRCSSCTAYDAVRCSEKDFVAAGHSDLGWSTAILRQLWLWNEGCECNPPENQADSRMCAHLLSLSLQNSSAECLSLLLLRRVNIWRWE